MIGQGGDKSIGDAGRLLFILSEPGRDVSYSTTLDGDGAQNYVDAFRQALRAFGFCEATVQRHIPESDE